MQNNFPALQDAGEIELIANAQQGSEAAFEELLRRHRKRLWRSAMYVLKNPDDAEDAVQTASWKAWRHLSKFRCDSSFGTWLTVIVVNQARMRLRELRRAGTLSLDDDSNEGIAWIPQISDVAPTPEEAYAGSELVRALHHEILRLPSQFKQVMLLSVEDRTMDEAADQLGVTLAAAKARLFRARQELYHRMRRYAGYTKSDCTLNNTAQAPRHTSVCTAGAATIARSIL